MAKAVGVLGGGQLGRMLAEAANKLNIRIVILDSERCPANQVHAHSDHINGSFSDPIAIRQLASKCDILTIEIEHVNTDVLEEISTMQIAEVQPGWQTIRIIQNKYLQKLYLSRNGIAVAESRPIEISSVENVHKISDELGYPLMLKSMTEAYDGKGNCPVKSPADISLALAQLEGRPLYAEKWANFTAELAVMVIKTEQDPVNHSGSWEEVTIAYPIVETIHEDSICKLVYAPARNLPVDIGERARSIARQAVAGFSGCGIFGVELFLLEDGNLLVNEIAPRCHNSGHYTIEACPISQFEAHLRAVLRLPIPEEGIRMRSSLTFAVMLNILGGAQPIAHLQVAEEALSIPGASVHLYGKGNGRPGRKMGHITVVASSMGEAESRVEPLIKLVDQIKAGPSSQSQASESFLFSNIAQPSLSQPKTDRTPLIAVTMGSDSDRFVLAAGIDFLKQLEIPYMVTITSAHRTPERMFQFAREAASKGIKVIIAAAGGAAHLPGMIAAITSLPVIGVPVKGSALEGTDSLLSIVQMPRGCPVATVAINNSSNAAQLAVRILAISDSKIKQRLAQYLDDQTASVIEKAERMERGGFETYGIKENT